MHINSEDHKKRAILEPLALPPRVYPAFVDIVRRMDLSAQTPRFAIGKSMGKGKMNRADPNQARGVKIAVARGLMKLSMEYDHHYEFTDIGRALALSLIGSSMEYDPKRFLAALPEDILVGLLTMPSKHERWWMRVMSDLGFVAKRQRSGAYDLVSDRVELILEYLRVAPHLPPPIHLQPSPSAREPDRRRIALFKAEVDRQMALYHDPNFGDLMRPNDADDPEPDFSFPYEDEWDII